MINRAALRARIVESGAKILHVANGAGISKNQFYRKLSGNSEFKESDICGIRRILRLTDEEFLGIFDTTSKIKKSTPKKEAATK